jgi:simple sugar transport system substrate-binding protein/basic membrane protein A
MSRTPRALAALFALSLLATGWGVDGDDSGSATDSTAEAGGDADFTVGFIYVGPKDDFGYNQAAYEGSQAVAEALPDVEILQSENVPETAESEAVMQDMIDKGADLIFATSYGHLEFAANMAEKNPEVTFVHQGGLEGDTQLDNLGTFFGTVYEPVYTAGIAAGAATESKKLGYVYAFPIPQTLANINAFTLGADGGPRHRGGDGVHRQLVRPERQAAVESLLDQGVDVITQHQDCTKTIIEGHRGGRRLLGGLPRSSLAGPEGWITGSEWNWGPLYTQIVETVMAGEFAESDFNGDFRVGLQTGDNPFIQSAFGDMVTEETKQAIEDAKQSFVDGGSPFAGPVNDQDGNEVYAEGEQPTYEEVEQMDFFVEGVIGTIG